MWVAATLLFGLLFASVPLGCFAYMVWGGCDVGER